MSSMRPRRFTLRNGKLDHQVVFYLPAGSSRVHVTCNCLCWIGPDGIEHRTPMGESTDLAKSRELYNNPDNHHKTFTEKDKAKW